jgi:hypothetical protein
VKQNNPEHLFNSHRRWCSNHMGEATVDGGKWIVSGSKKTHRWVCAACLARKAERMKEKAA